VGAAATTAKTKARERRRVIDTSSLSLSNSRNPKKTLVQFSTLSVYRQPSVIIRGYHYTIRRVLNTLVCLGVQKNVMANEIAGFGGLNFFFLCYLE
jgi:hypothetical protein